MTQAEKEAKELEEEFLKEFPSTDDIGFGQIKIAKKCALICVDEIISKGGTKNVIQYEPNCFTNGVEYWEEVKKAIEKL